MSYREKIAWLSLLAMAIAFGPYFTITMTTAPVTLPPQSLPNLRQMSLYAEAAFAQMIILGIGHFYLLRTSPQDARIPPDERDRAIMSRSVNFAYYVLIAGMIVVGIVMPFKSSGWTLVNAAIFMILAAEVVHYGVIVMSYRRQAG
jgi:hypothetical protein